jgi:hypothetical protein
MAFGNAHVIKARLVRNRRGGVLQYMRGRWERGLGCRNQVRKDSIQVMYSQATAAKDFRQMTAPNQLSRSTRGG